MKGKKGPNIYLKKLTKKPLSESSGKIYNYLQRLNDIADAFMRSHKNLTFNN